MTTSESHHHTGLAVDILLPKADHAAVEDFLKDRSFPLVEGPFCTFVYRGDTDAVDLRHWIIGLPSTQAMQRIEGTDLWYVVIEVPENSRFEYKLEIHHHGETRLIQDPRNPHLARDPFGANSVCQATGYKTPFWTREVPGTRQGWLEERDLYSHALGDHRPITIYYPYRYRRTSSYPLLIVHDGLDYVQYAAFKTVLDNLIDRYEIPKMIVALTQAKDRFAEYAASQAHADFLAKDLVPDLESKLPLLGTPESRTLMGASLGAVASLHAAACHPGTFQNLFLSSGSFAFTDIGDHDKGPIFDRIVEFVNDFRRSPDPVAGRVFVTCGTYESLIYENRSLVPVLQRSGMNVRYVEARDGHNWENWRDRLREGLSWLSPGPLWMVYE